MQAIEDWPSFYRTDDSMDNMTVDATTFTRL